MYYTCHIFAQAARKPLHERLTEYNRSNLNKVLNDASLKYSDDYSHEDNDTNA